MKLEFLRIESAHHELFSEAMRLYSVSFPHHEQRKSAAQIEVLVDPEYYFYAVLCDGEFAGDMLCWISEDFVYVEHFCILESLRSKGVGSEALKKLCSEHSCVILEIDPPVDEISIRRKGFYERAGFFENTHKHAHPPYHSENAPHELVIMSSGSKISEEKYYAFAAYLKERVMKYV